MVRQQDSIKSFRNNTDEFVRAMVDARATNPLRFKYRKRDGTVRFARGYIPRGYWVNVSANNIFAYWDLDRKGWRSLYTTNLL